MEDIPEGFYDIMDIQYEKHDNCPFNLQIYSAAHEFIGPFNINIIQTPKPVLIEQLYNMQFSINLCNTVTKKYCDNQIPLSIWCFVDKTRFGLWLNYFAMLDYSREYFLGRCESGQLPFGGLEPGCYRCFITILRVPK